MKKVCDSILTTHYIKVCIVYFLSGALWSLYLCLCAQSDVQHILCVFVLISFILCTLCCQCLWIFLFSSTFRRKKVELLSSLRRQRLRLRLGRLSFRLSFLSESISQKTIKDMHLKLGILVHYQKRNQLQEGRYTYTLKNIVQGYALNIHLCDPVDDRLKFEIIELRGNLDRNDLFTFSSIRPQLKNVQLIANNRLTDHSLSK